MLALTGCDALHKMHQVRQLEKAKEQFAFHPDSFATEVAKAYPVLPEKLVDTSSKKNDSAFMSTITDMANMISEMQVYYDSVVNSVRSKTVYDTINSSDCNKTINDLLNLVQRQAHGIDTLKKRLATIPPVTITKPLPVPVANDAAMQVLKNASAGKDKTIATITEANKHLSERLNRNIIEKWVTWGILILILIFLIARWIQKLRTG